VRQCPATLSKRVRRKPLLFCVGILAPEFLLMLALAQWVSARRSVKEFRELGYPKWSMKHAFFADMGGFVLHDPSWVPFPLNAKQVHYLVAEGYLPFSTVGIDDRMIEDKNKGDAIARLIAVFQILWFTLNILGRAIQHLAITTLELTTLSFICCSLGTWFFWSPKPKDVGIAITLEPNARISDILVRAGDIARNPYKSTPLDFVGAESLSSVSQLYWAYGMTFLWKAGIKLHTGRRPIDKIPDAHFPGLQLFGVAVFAPLSLISVAIPVVGSNFDFPTTVERILWRIASVTMIVYITVVCLLDLGFRRRILNGIALSRQRLLSTEHSAKKFDRSLSRFRYNSPDHDPEVILPVRIVVFTGAILGLLYSVARGYVLLEDFINLRKLPASAYQTVNWSTFIPHIW